VIMTRHVWRAWREFPKHILILDIAIRIDQLHAKIAYSVLRKYSMRHGLCSEWGSLQHAYVKFLTNYAVYETAHFIILRDKRFIYQYYVKILSRVGGYT
jgi:hypothetical protein